MAAAFRGMSRDERRQNICADLAVSLLGSGDCRAVDTLSEYMDAVDDWPPLAARRTRHGVEIGGKWLVSTGGATPQAVGRTRGSVVYGTNELTRGQGEGRERLPECGVKASEQRRADESFCGGRPEERDGAAIDGE